VARWTRTDEGIPPELIAYDPAIYGPGDEGIRTWRRAAVDYLNDHPDKVMPFGIHGDVLEVFRESLRHMGAYA
jgi:hypothetical protein